MPYIKQEFRGVLDRHLDGVIEAICTLEPDESKRKGLVNYVATRIALNSLRPANDWGYTSISEAVAALRDASVEIERRLLAIYEDGAISRHGDLIEYQERISTDERGFIKWRG